MARPVRVVGLGGSLRAESTSRMPLQVALDGAAASGAEVELLAIRDLGLPLYTAEHGPPPGADEFAETVYASDAMIWSSPTYQGSVSGAFKNALDWLILLGDRTPPYLSNKPIGLVSTAGGVQGLQTVNAMDFIARSLRGWSVPLVCRCRSRGRRSTRTGAWSTMRSAISCARSAPRSPAPPASSSPRAPATTPEPSSRRQRRPLTCGQLGRPGWREMSTIEMISSAPPKVIRE